MAVDATESARRAAGRARDAAQRAREAAEEASDRPVYDPVQPPLPENPGFTDGVRRRLQAHAMYRQGEALYARRDYLGRAREAERGRGPGSEPRRGPLRCWGGPNTSAGRYHAAVVTFKTVLRRQPTWEGLYDGLGWSRLRLGRFYLASAAFRAALDQNPEYLDSIIGLGSAEFELGRYATSLPYLQKALGRLQPLVGEAPPAQAGVRAQVAWNLYYLGRYGEAVEMFERTIRSRPEWYGLYSGAGWSYLGLGRKAEARIAFEKALSLKPGYQDALDGLGLATDQPRLTGRGDRVRPRGP